MSRPSRYDEAARKLTAEVGLNKEVQTSAAELAQLTNMPGSAISRALNVMMRVGTAKQRNEWTGTGGRRTFYTLVGDFAETERRMKAQGIPWSGFVESNTPAGAAPKPQNGSVKSLAELSPMRKSEPRAELEVARKYRDQQAFIVEQRKRFVEMGLEMPDPKPLYDEGRRMELEAIGRILPYIESIERANTNLEEQNKTIRAPMSELSDLRQRTARQKEQIETLVREKGQVKDDVQRVLDDHRKEVQGYKEQISRLEGEIRQLRGDKAINGAVTRHEAQQAISKVG